MGHLFARMATRWLEQQTASIMTQNGLKPIYTKRKRIDNDNISNKRKIVINSTTMNDSDNDDDNERVSLSPRVSPIILKVTKSSNLINHSSSSMTLFKCQLCRRCLRNKDIYMDHMTMCAVQRQASIKIIRAEKNKDEISIL
ncbi:unnamed protein product [Rotaria sp. Silwood1]|nr:unnamed protein product [Rotaria sp. Silwood1]CAF1613040.1 unnamed protein product [Rotaria sp. Silwood1]CAF3799082.1 unnamed protein product [Rotaria sp. Silwood1]CAF4572980.1 unnamed protein product [Rotaria sp. Silwood1]